VLALKFNTNFQFFAPSAAGKKEPAEAGCFELSAKQLSVRPSSNERYALRLQFVNQKQVTLGVTFTVIRPFALKFVI
jgi:hypothetical protein